MWFRLRRLPCITFVFHRNYGIVLIVLKITKTMTLVAPKKPHRSHRKRSGLHQHKHKNFGKTYWPYLPLLLVVGLGFVLNSLWPSQRDVLGYATEMSASSLLSGTNQQRANNGKASLTINSKLTTAAQNKAKDMAAKDYWSHNSPTGQTPWSFITAAGYKYKTAGENLAYGFDTSADTITGWMNSAEHRANILNSSYTNVGFGIVNIPNYQGDGPETLVVAMYASPVAVATTTKSPSTSQPVNTSTLKQSTPVTSNGAATTPTKVNKTTQQPPASTTQQSDTLMAPPSVVEQTAAEQPTKTVSRIQLVANGEAAWSMMAILVIITVSFAVLLVRHGMAWHRLLNRGERFVLKHPLLDIAIVTLITVGVVLSNTAGFIK